jgi:hypothetical protein
MKKSKQSTLINNKMEYLLIVPIMAQVTVAISKMELAIMEVQKCVH